MAIHPTVKTLLDEIEALRVRAEMSATAFGSKVLNDPSFISNLRKKGRVPSLETAAKVRRFISGYGDSPQ
jgi:hypothetical protein